MLQWQHSFNLQCFNVSLSGSDSVELQQQFCPMNYSKTHLHWLNSIFTTKAKTIYCSCLFCKYVCDKPHQKGIPPNFCIQSWYYYIPLDFCYMLFCVLLSCVSVLCFCSSCSSSSWRADWGHLYGGVGWVYLSGSLPCPHSLTPWHWTACPFVLFSAFIVICK